MYTANETGLLFSADDGGATVCCMYGKSPQEMHKLKMAASALDHRAQMVYFIFMITIKIMLI